MEKYLLLDNIRSLENIGALFRTADGAGFDRVYLTGYTATPPRKEISKTALSAEKSVFWEYYEDPLEIIKKLKQESAKIISLEQTNTSINIFSPEIHKLYNSQTLCLIVGNEIDGIQDTLLKESDLHIELPMMGIKKSLNVAVAGGISMYTLAFGEK